MSEERKKNMKGEEDDTSDGSDDEHIDNLDIGNGVPVSSSNYTVDASSDLSMDTGQDLQHYVSEGIEVQASDILIIEELSDESFQEERHSSEWLETTAFYEFPTDFDEENCSHLPQAYFNNVDNLHFHENVGIPDTNDNYSLPHVLGKQKNKQLKEPDKKRRNKAVSENDVRRTEGTSAATSDTINKKKVKELKEKKLPVLEMQYNRCDVVKNPHVPIYEFMCDKSKNKCDTLDLDDIKQRKIKCPEFSSKEFTDIEDNLRDSSSDNNESISKEQIVEPMPLKGLFFDIQSQQRRRVEPLGGSKALKAIPMTCSSSSENNVSADNFQDKSFPSTSKDSLESSSSYFSQSNSKRIKTVPVVKASNEAKKKLKAPMATIVEVPESEDEAQNLKTSQPSHSKASSLKMKARVGNKRDKCNVCNVRLGLCAIKCRCGGYYCAKHRYDKEHNCTFDYRTMGAEEIRKNNPKIVAEKVRKL